MKPSREWRIGSVRMNLIKVQLQNFSTYKSLSQVNCSKTFCFDASNHFKMPFDNTHHKTSDMQSACPNIYLGTRVFLLPLFPLKQKLGARDTVMTLKSCFYCVQAKFRNTLPLQERCVFTNGTISHLAAWSVPRSIGKMRLPFTTRFP